jgi:hypothetical protein
MSRITHSLVGYDRISDRVADEFDVPDAILPTAKELAGVPADDPDAMMCYPLDASRARDLADLIKARIDTERRDYFLEGVAYEFAKFRLESQNWSVWIHDDAKKAHAKVTIARTTLDDYASNHGHKDHRVVIDLLNAKIKDQVQEIINRAIRDGRTMADRLELNEHDLAVMLDN